METLIHLKPKTLAEKLVWERSLSKELKEQLSKTLVEKGKLKSELDELKFQYKNLKIKFEKTDYKRDLNLKKELKSRQETINHLRRTVDKLNYEIVQLKLKNEK